MMNKTCIKRGKAAGMQARSRCYQFQSHLEWLCHVVIDE